MPMDCSSWNCLCRNGNVRWITFQFLRFRPLAAKSPMYETCNRNSVDSSNEILRRKIIHCTFQRVLFCFLWFSSSGRIVSIQPFSKSIRTSNCTFSSYLAIAGQDFLKTVQLFPFPPLSMSTSFSYLFFYGKLKTAIEIAADAIYTKWMNERYYWVANETHEWLQAEWLMDWMVDWMNA